MTTKDKKELVQRINAFFKTDVSKKDRYYDTINAKANLAYYMRVERKCKLQEIATLLECHHANVMHHVQKHTDFMESNKKYKETYQKLLLYLNHQTLCFPCVFNFAENE